MIQFSENEEPINADSSNKHERFTGGARNSDWPIQKVDFTKISVEESMTY